MADQEQDEREYVVPTEEGFAVFRTESDLVGIRQRPEGYEEQVVVVTPEKVGKLIQFLISMKDDILTERADAAAGEAPEPGLRVMKRDEGKPLPREMKEPNPGECYFCDGRE